MALFSGVGQLWRRSALILVIVAILVLIVTLNIGNVSAQSLNLTPNPVTQGMNVQVTGSDFEPDENAQIQVYASTSGSCAAIPSMSLAATTDSNGALMPVTIPTSGLSAGTYCVEGNGFLDAPATVNLVVNPTTTAAPTAGAPTIPVYAYCIPPIAVVIFLVYSVMKRRTQD
jgi:hypothetical protein